VTAAEAQWVELAKEAFGFVKGQQKKTAHRNQGETIMTTIKQGDGTVTLINVFTVQPGAQQQLLDTWIAPLRKLSARCRDLFRRPCT